MVIESLINPLKAEKKPWEMFFLGLVYNSIAILISLKIFRDYSSLVMVFLTVMACTPIMYATIRMEEKKDLEYDDEKRILKEHGKALTFFMMLFFGITVSCTLWYLLLPADTSTLLFSVQSHTITSINARVVEPLTGNFGATSNLVKIFINNLWVLIFCIAFAFVYGVGAIFVLTWNASVIGVAIGNFIRSKIAALAASAGAVGVGNYMSISVLGVFRYATHGFWEILAYFIGGLAGGIISVAIIRHDFGTKKFEKIILDSADLIIISIVMLFVAALIEVFITPALF